MNAWLRAGGPHHQVLNLGHRAAAWEVFCELSGIELAAGLACRAWSCATRTIVLRHWRADDADAVYEACQDLDMLQWLPLIPRPYTREDARAFVTRELDLGPHQFAIEKDGRVVGSIGMTVNQNETAHLGYWCLRSERGQGIVPRAVRLLERYAFEELGLGRVELITDPDNRPRSGSPRRSASRARACCARICSTPTAAAATR